MTGSSPSEESRLPALAAALCAIISIQMGASLAKQMFQVAGAAGATLLRVGIASVLLLVVWRPWRYPLQVPQWKAIALYGLVLGGMNFTFYLALERIPLGIAVALEFLGPLALAFFTSRRPLDGLWGGLAALGVALILPLSDSIATADRLDPWGIFFALTAGACWALYIVLGQRAGKIVPMGALSTWGACVGVLLVLPWGMPGAAQAMSQSSLWPMALGMAVLSSVVPYSLELVAMKRLPTRTFAILMSLEPAVAALSGWAFLNELLNAQQTLAVGAVVVASLGSTWTARGT